VLDALGIVRYLSDRGLLQLAEVIDGEVQLVDASRRNRSTHVLRTRGPSYVVKQGIGHERITTIAHEADAYAYLASMNDRELAAVVPALVDYDPATCILICEYIPRSISLERHHAKRGCYSTSTARRLAHSLLAVHRATALAGTSSRSRFETAGMAAWTLRSLHRPSANMLHGLSNGATLAIRMLQSTPDFTELLDEMTRQWTPCCLIHGDMRFDNCLIAPAGTARARIVIVDWELALWGDPSYDIGTVLAGYLASWVLSCPINGEAPLELLLGLGRYRLSDMQRAAGAFWSTYRDGSPLTTDDGLSLERAMRFAAVGLLQFMFEELQASTELTARAVCLAQLARNLLERPAAAAEHFLAGPVAA
jgi:hypothetical protein